MAEVKIKPYERPAVGDRVRYYAGDMANTDFAIIEFDTFYRKGLICVEAGANTLTVEVSADSPKKIAEGSADVVWSSADGLDSPLTGSESKTFEPIGAMRITATGGAVKVRILTR